MHTYIIGKTGSGKSTLIKNLVKQDIETGHGLAVIDPHGDLAQEILSMVPKSRYHEVVYFDPREPIGLNVLSLPTDSIVNALRSIWSDSWGARMEWILVNAVNACKEANQTLLGVMRMLVDEKYRERIVKRVRDPVTKQFWLLEFAGYDKRFMTEAIAPIQNKVGRFLASPIRYSVGQTKGKVDIPFIMNNRRIFIANLSKGSIGEDNSKLLGSLLVSMFQSAALARESIPESERVDFYLYVDEFHNFVTESFAAILSEARKYRLNLILAHQYIDQLSETVRKAVFGNVGTLVSFRLGTVDAEYIAQELQLEHEDIQNLSPYNIYIRLLIDGAQYPAFSAITFPLRTLYTPPQGLIKTSTMHYASPDAKARIDSWLSSSYEETHETRRRTYVASKRIGMEASP